MQAGYWTICIALFAGGAFAMRKILALPGDRLRQLGFAALAIGMGECMLTILLRKDLKVANVFLDAVWPFMLVCALFVLLWPARKVENKAILWLGIVLALLPGPIHAYLIRSSARWQEIFFGFWVEFGGIAW